jgi:hypothetical protein
VRMRRIGAWLSCTASALQLASHVKRALIAPGDDMEAPRLSFRVMCVLSEPTCRPRTALNPRAVPSARREGLGGIRGEGCAPS